MKLSEAMIIKLDSHMYWIDLEKKKKRKEKNKT